MASTEGGDVDVFGMGPWEADVAPPILGIPAMRNPRDIFLTSEEYIALLESKLKRITRRTDKNPSSKEMLRCLVQSKESQMKTLTDESADPYISNHDFVTDDQETRLAAIHRRLHPERQSLNPEERKHLVDNDELGRMVLEMKTEDQENAEQDWKRRLSHPNIPTHQKHSDTDDKTRSQPDGEEDPAPPDSEHPSAKSLPQSPVSDDSPEVTAEQSTGGTGGSKESSHAETKEVNTAEKPCVKPEARSEEKPSADTDENK